MAPVRWAMLVIVLALSFLYWRNVTLFLIVSVSLLAELLALVVASCLRWAPLLKTYARISLLALIILAASELFLWGPEHVMNVWQSGTAPEKYFEQTDYPIEAVRWIRTHRDEVGTRLYHDYGHGGFLLWQLPDVKIFIDGRMPAWRINDRRILRVHRFESSGFARLVRAGSLWCRLGVGPSRERAGSDPGVSSRLEKHIWRRQSGDCASIGVSRGRGRSSGKVRSGAQARRC